MRDRVAVSNVLVAASLLFAPSRTRAQRDSSAHAAATVVFRGRVVQQSDSTPLPNADVWLVSVDRHATTDSTGAFRFDGLPGGMQLVQIRHLGLDPQRATIALSADHENVHTYALSGQLVKLDTVRSKAAAQKYLSPNLRAFEERRLSGMGGQFISDSVLRKNENMTAANLIASRVPGLQQVSIVTTTGGLITTLASTRKPCAGLALLHAACGSKATCYAALYLDGVLQYSWKTHNDPPDFSKMYNVSDLAGVEYYAGGAAAPIDMHSDDGGCGSIWLWTRER